MKLNRLREMLASGKPTLSTRVNLCSPNIVEVLGLTGVFDYVEFLAEYGSFSLDGLENFCRAAELYHLGSMIKVDSEPRQFLAQRGLGAGFEGVLFADPRSPEDAAACVRLVKPETPQDGGLYGAANRRFAYVGQAGSAEYVEWLRGAVVAIMIEKRGAVDALDELLATPGIDLIQWGGADFSMSAGRPGERRSPELKAVERRVIEASLRAGIPARAEIHSADEAKEYLDLGVRHFSLSSDLNLLFSGWKDGGEALRKAMEE